MFLVPRPALRTDWTNIAAKPSAISAKTSATMTNVTFEPLRDTPPAAEVIKVPDINVLLYTNAPGTGGRTRPDASPQPGRRQLGPADAGPGAVADNSRTVSAARGGGHTRFRPCRRDVRRCVSATEVGYRTFLTFIGSATLNRPHHSDLGAGAVVDRANLQVIDKS